MKFNWILMMVAGLTLALASQARAQAEAGATADGAEAYYQQTIKALDGMEAGLGDISRSASEAADLFVNQNYSIAATGDPLFEYEAVGRCGGLMGISHFKKLKNKETWKGIILFAPRGPNVDDATVKQLNTMRQRGSKLVFFGRSETLADARKAGLMIDWVVDNHVSGPDGLVEAGGGKRVVPTSDDANLIALWTWTGEFVSACTRLGKMPAMYQGYVFPGGKERAKKIGEGTKFHEAKPEPVEALVAGKAYLADIRQSLEAVHATEMDKIARIAAEALAAKNAGKACYCYADGHAVGNGFGGAYEPGLFVEIGDWADDKPTIHAGDYIFGLGYIEAYASGMGTKDNADEFRKAAAKLGWTVGGTDAKAPLAPAGETVIDQHWPYGDAVFQYPGYDIKVLPPSGVMQVAVYDMICADMLAKR